jgi:hypothetical protein
MGEFLEKSGYTSGYTKSCEAAILTNLIERFFVGSSCGWIVFHLAVLGMRMHEKALSCLGLGL